MKSPRYGHSGMDVYFCLGAALQTQAVKMEKDAGSISHAKVLELDPGDKE